MRTSNIKLSHVAIRANLIYADSMTTFSIEEFGD